jgi:hypothetical protein
VCSSYVAATTGHDLFVFHFICFSIILLFVFQSFIIFLTATVFYTWLGPSNTSDENSKIRREQIATAPNQLGF